MKSLGDLLLAAQRDTIELVLELCRKNPLVYSRVKELTKELREAKLMDKDFTPSALKDFYFNTQSAILNYGNGEESLPALVGCMRGLRIFGASGYCISSLPETYQRLSSLTSFSVRDSLFTKIPEVCYSWKNLEFLVFSNSLIGSVPRRLNSLKHLSTLMMSGERLSEVEAGFAPKELINLDLSNTHIIKLPPEVWSLPKLSILNLCDSKFEALPSKLPHYRRGRGELRIDLTGTKAGLDYPTLKALSREALDIRIKTSDPYSTNPNPLEFYRGRVKFVASEKNIDD